jgi:hypothetical protein
VGGDCLPWRRRSSPAIGYRKDPLTRTLTILFPDGSREYWFTELDFEPGGRLERNGESWLVVSVAGVNEDGKHTSLVVQPDGDGLERGDVTAGSSKGEHHVQGVRDHIGRSRNRD